jgi:hypothetical protein
MPALYTYIKLCGRFQSTAAKLKIVRTVEICAHMMCGHVPAHISILKKYQY